MINVKEVRGSPRTIKTKQGLAYAMYSKHVERSVNKGWPKPDYSKEELKEWLLSQPSFDVLYNQWLLSGCTKSLIPSVDRIDDNKYYSLSNIQLMAWQENFDKSRVDIKSGNNRKLHQTIYQYSLQGEFIQKFFGVNQAAKHLKCSSSTISNAIKRQSSSLGFYWSKGKHKMFKGKSCKQHPVAKIDEKGNVVQTYSKLIELREEFGTATADKYVSLACRSGKKYKGYYWKLLNELKC